MAKIVKVGLDGKKPALVRKSCDFATGVIVVTVTQYWLVEFDSPVTDPALCFGASFAGYTLPDTGYLYGGSSAYQGLVCNQVLPTLDPTSAGKLYRVQVDYSSLPQPANTGKWNITISIDGMPVTEPIAYDSTGKAIVNSAGQQFSNQPTRTKYDNVYRVAFQSNKIDIATIDELEGTLNAAEFTLQVKSLGFKKTFEAQSTQLVRCPSTTTLTGDPKTPAFWNVEYELHYRRPIVSPIDGSTQSGWTLFILDQGYAKSSGGATPDAILDGNHNPLNSPQYLDGSGNVSSTAHWLQFAPAETTADFTPLFDGIG